MSTVPVSFGLAGLLLPAIYLLLLIGLVIAIVLAVRALRGIDRSLRVLVEQGVARGEGPFDAPTR
ncbi:hypothetical protein SAMN04487783_1468 [Agrococcus baldri]|uniref:Uncharacterized protein n=1 Tax=Agrococcus baldri TaxID=153730 RepID=A0AA94HMF4_9MICO|nr:hypothetical protein [Agrococcus baldri]SFS10838.1 hypothetical protein SAMN04487783_1468 [Agrococcus baldri]